MITKSRTTTAFHAFLPFTPSDFSHPGVCCLLRGLQLERGDPVYTHSTRESSILRLAPVTQKLFSFSLPSAFCWDLNVNIDSELVSARRRTTPLADAEDLVSIHRYAHSRCGQIDVAAIENWLSRKADRMLTFV